MTQRRRPPKAKPVVFRFESQCKDKARFAKGWMAQEKAEALLMRVYKCVYCHGWHLTSRLKV